MVLCNLTGTGVSVIQEVMDFGSCAGIWSLPKASQDYFSFNPVILIEANHTHQDYVVCQCCVVAYDYYLLVCVES